MSVVLMIHSYDKKPRRRFIFQNLKSLDFIDKKEIII
jgi:hypothetical protein